MSSIKAVLFAQQEQKSGLELECALDSARNRHLVSEVDIQGLEFQNAEYLYALNPHSRIIWGDAFIQHFADYHGLTQDNLIPNQKLTWVTLADISCVTTDKPQEIDFEQFRRRYRPALRGLNFIGMIEPGYYTNIAQGSRFAGTRMVSWHLHAIAWGEDFREIQRRFLALNRSGKYRPIYEGAVALHAVRLPPNQIPIKLRYILKSPRKSYTIGKHTRTVDGERRFRFIQNKRNLRSGERIKLVLLMNDVYLPQLAMAGGEGAELLRRIKYEALRELRESRDS